MQNKYYVLVSSTIASCRPHTVQAMTLQSAASDRDITLYDVHDSRGITHWVDVDKRLVEHVLDKIFWAESTHLLLSAANSQ